MESSRREKASPTNGPLQPDRLKVPGVEQATDALPMYPDAHDSPVQVVSVRCPSHPLPLYAYPVVSGLGRTHVAVHEEAEQREGNSEKVILTQKQQCSCRQRKPKGCFLGC